MLNVIVCFVVFDSKAYLPLPRDNPCLPSPCGLYSDCHVVSNHPVCSCLAGYLGAPPDCHPECMISAQCPFDRACINQQCVDPCPGICGLNAMCRAVNHNPICSCAAGYIGDPFTRCVPIPEPSKSRDQGIERCNTFFKLSFGILSSFSNAESVFENQKLFHYFIVEIS